MGNDTDSSKPPEKTARFAQLVKESGTPEPYTLWQAPDKDPSFQRALRENRVMTVVQKPAGTKTDYGLVGYHEEKSGAYLIFPKTLRAFEGKKVVGVKYELLAEPKPIGAVVKTDEPKPRIVQPREIQPKFFEPKILPPPAPSERTTKEKEKLPKRFLVSISVTAQLELEKEFEAENQKEAKNLAEERVRDQKPDFSQGTLKISVRKVKVIQPRGASAASK